MKKVLVGFNLHTGSVQDIIACSNIQHGSSIELGIPVQYKDEYDNISQREIEPCDDFTKFVGVVVSIMYAPTYPPNIILGKRVDTIQSISLKANSLGVQLDDTSDVASPIGTLIYINGGKFSTEPTVPQSLPVGRTVSLVDEYATDGLTTNTYKGVYISTDGYKI